MHPALTTPLATAAALPLIAMVHGAKPLAAFNASAHWLDQTAGAIPAPHPVFTPVGLATNLAAAAMWGAIMGAALSRTGKPVLTAAAVAATAAAVDYGLMPRRLTPGWEMALPRSAVAATFAAMALGMAAGTVRP